MKLNGTFIVKYKAPTQWNSQSFFFIIACTRRAELDLCVAFQRSKPTFNAFETETVALSGQVCPPAV